MPWHKYDLDSPLRVAYSGGMLNINSPERGVINGLLDLGRFVVVTHYPKYCPVTDASVGEIMSAVGSFDSYEVAQAFCDSYQPSPDERVTIECPDGKWPGQRAMATLALERADCEDDCPF